MLTGLTLYWAVGSKDPIGSLVGRLLKSGDGWELHFAVAGTAGDPPISTPVVSVKAAQQIPSREGRFSTPWRIEYSVPPADRPSLCQEWHLISRSRGRERPGSAPGSNRWSFSIKIMKRSGSIAWILETCSVTSLSLLVLHPWDSKNSDPIRTKPETSSGFARRYWWTSLTKIYRCQLMF